MTADSQPVFLYDLGDPVCYLAAERVMDGLGEVPEWEPVHAAAMGISPGVLDESELSRWAGELGLLPFRMPAQMPADTGAAMLAATYAKAVGRAVAFSQAAFRQAFAGGRDPGAESTILLAGAACEVHPTALLKGMQLTSVRNALSGATQRAQAAGVTRLPAILVGDQVASGPGCVEEAAALLDKLPA